MWHNLNFFFSVAVHTALFPDLPVAGGSSHSSWFWPGRPKRKSSRDSDELCEVFVPLLKGDWTSWCGLSLFSSSSCLECRSDAGNVESKGKTKQTPAAWAQPWQGGALWSERWKCLAPNFLFCEKIRVFNQLLLNTIQGCNVHEMTQELSLLRWSLDFGWLWRVSVGSYLVIACDSEDWCWWWGRLCLCGGQVVSGKSLYVPLSFVVETKTALKH